MKLEAISIIADDVLPAFSKLSLYIKQVGMNNSVTYSL